MEEVKLRFRTDLHVIPLEELMSTLSTDAKRGLSTIQANFNYTQDGPNIQTALKNMPLWRKIGCSLYTIFNLQLLATASICFVLGAIPCLQPTGTYYLDNVYLGCALSLVLILSIICSLYMERKAETIEHSSSKLHSPKVVVIRNGEVFCVAMKEVVMGDLIMLKKGDSIPADLRIVEASSLKVVEFFTSGDLERSSKLISVLNAPPLEMDSVVFYGSYVVEGRGKGIVIATGDMAVAVRAGLEPSIFQFRETSLNKDARKLIRALWGGSACFALILFGLSFLVMYPWLDALIYFIAVLVVMRPEMIWVAVTISLMSAAELMISKKCLIKDLEIVEKLASTTVLCCDKHGVLSTGDTIVRHIIMDGKIAIVDESNFHEKFRKEFSEATWNQFIKTASLCYSSGCQSLINKNDGLCVTAEEAILKFLNLFVADVESIGKNYRKVFERPLKDGSSYGLIIHELTNVNGHHSHLISVNGEVDVILKFCNRVLLNGKEMPKTYQILTTISQDAEKMMSMGMNVVGFCDIELAKKAFPHDQEFLEDHIPLRGFRFLGFLALEDPLRPNIENGIKKCREAGIRVILTTSDNPMMAEIVARQIGLILPTNQTRDELASTLKIPPHQIEPGSVPAIVLKGEELLELSTSDLLNILSQYKEIVFARLTSSQKALIVKGFQQIGETVAITGCNTSSCDALLKADIGIGIGNHNCDFCLECADMIILNDSFESITEAIEDARLALENIEKSVSYNLTCHSTGIVPFFLMVVLGVPLPLGPVFLVLILVATDMFPTVAVTQDKADSYIMRTTPQRIKMLHKNFLSKAFQRSYCQIAVVKALAGLYAYFIVMAENGFLPNRLLSICRVWYSSTLNDLQDSYNQEWTYSARKDLEYTSQTAFFISVLIVQWTIALISRIRKGTLWEHGFRNYILNFSIIFGTLMVMILCYIPGAYVFHFFPIKFMWWFPAIPFGMLILAYDELRRYVIKLSYDDS